MSTAVITTPSIRSWPISRLDVAGAFGDIGILLPISFALVTLNYMNPTAVFLAAGITYILAGGYFQIPMAVQPLKAVAAIALALALPPSDIASAGLLMGLILAIVGLTNVGSWIAKLFTLPMVRGIQLGLGLLLVREGLRIALGTKGALVFAEKLSVPGWIIAVGAAAILLACKRSDRYPAALVLLGAGVTLGLLVHWTSLPQLSWGPLPIEVLHPRATELWKVLPLLVLPQLALTFGNSIVATENTAQILYGPQARRVTVRGLSLSIAFVNLVSGFLQGAPLCHGSGGVTAHYRFGARTPKSSYIIGSACLTLALFGRAATGALQLVPMAVLGVFLVYVGIQHAAYLRDIKNRTPLLALAITIGVVSLLTNLTWGFLAGLVLQVLLQVTLRRTSSEEV
jgi:sulfate permease, SulP family